MDRTELLAEAVELQEEVIINSQPDGGAVARYACALFRQRAQTFAPIFSLVFGPFSPLILPCSQCFSLRSF